MPLPLSALLVLAVQSAPAAQAEMTQAELERLTSEIQVQVAQQRAREFRAPVAVALADKAGFIEYALERERATTTPAERRTQELSLQLLGAIDHDLDLRAVELDLLQKQVGGFYDPARDSFCLMRGFPTPVARVILSHELTHALDDQLYDIDGTLKNCRGGDARLAFAAVVEGSGMTVMRQWMAEEMRAGRLRMADLTDVPGLGSEGLDQAPEALWKPLLCAYLQGAAFLVRTDSVVQGQVGHASSDDIERAFRDPPRSTEQVLHPEKYWNAEQRDLPRQVQLSAAALPDGWSETGQDTLGEVGLALIATPRAERKKADLATLMSAKFTNPAAAGWDGDRVAVYENGAAAALLLHTVWDAPRDAQEFAAALEAQRTELLQNLVAPEGAPSGFEVRGLGETEVQVWVWRGADPTALRAAVSARVAADPLAVPDPAAAK